MELARSIKEILVTENRPLGWGASSGPFAVSESSGTHVVNGFTEKTQVSWPL
jgi:hypothetical protein